MGGGLPLELGTCRPTDECGAHVGNLPANGSAAAGLVELVAGDGRTESSRYEAVHFSRVRMSTEGRFGEDQLRIEPDLETAAAAGQQHCPGDPRRPRVEELSHQTGGSIRVVSDDAELDLELMRSVWLFSRHGRTLRRDRCRRHQTHTRLPSCWSAEGSITDHGDP